ncbi:helix-turn-helix transcriptional regulator [Kitasatospora acidiphila]|uniref:Helix-turn-helix transcriptional regulator n=1 Tax=Kitasatospora acidiphila TaxID=2567942 RepID=A0A540WG04_9ACTN|nr:helix-turn-helix domain-containing protein [Kitasatospora acidiphila]TQF07354.1 helix-turn-helix transcriptional regulator [Kitasatospora acidiphila]
MAEHRLRQRTALLDAARALLTEGGPEALTFPALAARTGLARSSVYEYFRSRTDVVERLCELDLPLWAAEIEAAMAAADDPLARLEAYVRGQLALAGDPRHRAVLALGTLELDEAARARIRTAHGALTELVVEDLAALGHQEPRLTAALLQGLVEAAVRRSADCSPTEREQIADAAVTLARCGVAGV